VGALFRRRRFEVCRISVSVCRRQRLTAAMKPLPVTYLENHHQEAGASGTAFPTRTLGTREKGSVPFVPEEMLVVLREIAKKMEAL